MAGTGARRTGWRNRRPVRLLVIGLVSSLGATLAVAAVVVSTRHSADVSAQPLSIRAEPSSRTVAQGASARFAVRVARRHSSGPNRLGLSGRTSLRLATALPSGAGVSFTSQRGIASQGASRHSTTLIVTTAVNTPPGTYILRVRADRPHRSGSTGISLIVSDRDNAGAAPVLNPPAPPLVTPDAFTIDGALPDPLTPGTAVPLDLTLTNEENTDLSISSLGVQVTSVGGPQSDPTHPCSANDFSVKQFSGTPGFALPASSTASLSELGFAPAEWPEISMLNLPVNQDGCKQASLSLFFSGAATEATP